MNYVVIDLEWNQATSSKSSVFHRLPIHLHGEIIQIGAVKLDRNFKLISEFNCDVKPVYFRRMHRKVKKLTGIGKERLKNGLPFTEAFELLREYCGENVFFITWGADDKGIMEENIMVHDCDWDWISGWINLQQIFNMQINGDKSQKALSTAMEHFGIEQTRVAHDALGDAYNTALVCEKLDMEEGLRQYTALKTGQRMKKAVEVETDEHSEALLRKEYGEFASKGEFFAGPEAVSPFCPICGEIMSGGRWARQGGQRYINIFKCPQHPKTMIRLKFKKNEIGLFLVSGIFYEADEDMIKLHKSRMSYQKRRHGAAKKSRERGESQ
jgi:inhibitor of KinA sporulation pathway (predicted exonuclease)